MEKVNEKINDLEKDSEVKEIKKEETKKTSIDNNINTKETEEIVEVPEGETCPSRNEIKKGESLAIFLKEGCLASENINEILNNVDIDDDKVGNVPENFVILEETKDGKCSDVFDQYDIKMCPTFIRMKDGKVIGRVDGIDPNALKAILEEKSENLEKAPIISKTF